jgi:predicted aconitase
MMADATDPNPNPERRAELEAALGPAADRVRGIEEMLEIEHLTPDLKAFLQGEHWNANLRRSAIADAIEGLDRAADRYSALISTGYPAVDAVEMPADLAAELDHVIADFLAVRATFKAGAPDLATRIEATAGEPRDKAPADAPA